MHRRAPKCRDEVLRDIGERPANAIAADDRRTHGRDVRDVAQQGLELRPVLWRGETVLGEEGLSVPESGLHLASIDAAVDLRRIGYRAQKRRPGSRLDRETGGAQER